MKISMEVLGADTVAAKFNSAPSRIRPRLAGGINIGAKLLESSAKKRARFKTGNMRRGIHVSKSATAGDLNAEVTSEANYSSGIEEGNDPHVIVPKNAKVLAFTMGGEQIFARRVEHPGNKPYPFMKPAGEEIRPKLIADLEKIIKEAVLL